MNNADLDMDQTIDPQDDMFVHGRAAHYFGVARSALRYIELARESAGLRRDKVRRVLDLPSGHGRVLRALKASYPDAELTACDLQTHGVDFCASQFGAVPIYSQPSPADVPLVGQYDLIWSGSLLTHLDAKGWEGFVTLFSKHLAVGGVCVFTAHGRNTMRHISRRDETYGLRDSQLTKLAAMWRLRGFGYQNYDGDRGYGVSVSSMAWVARLITSRPELSVCLVAETAWDAHHDVYAFTRVADTYSTSKDTKSLPFRLVQAATPERVIRIAKRAQRR